MTRARFLKLPAEQQERILASALEEFAGHGYRDASLNRIIEAAGISKGSMYYYFDGKEDLYAHVARERLDWLFEQAGPLPVPTPKDPDEFWSELERDYRVLIELMLATPSLAALVRDWLGGTPTPTLNETMKEAEQQLIPWLEQTIAVGQRVGAVRTDIPTGLIIALVMGMGQAMDTWLITSAGDQTAPDAAVHTLVSMIRRAVAPDETPTQTPTQTPNAEST